MNTSPKQDQKHNMVRRICHLMIAGVMVFAVATPAPAAVRIKDITTVQGIRENMLIGYGLVVGLNGTGDKLNNNAFTEQSLVAFLERLGVNTRGSDLKSRNVAAVTVTAALPPFARQGGRINVTASAMGDAQSLLGGVLLATPLYGADGEVYAVAQGPLVVGGFEAEGEGASITKGVPTTGYIANGAIVEKEVDFALNELDVMRLALRNPDIATARQIAEAINFELGVPAAAAIDPGTVELDVPNVYQSDVAGLIGDIEQLMVTPDQVAKVVIDESTGTIVMGENVRIDEVAIAQGNLVVKISEEPEVVQPGAFAPEGAETEVTPRTEISVTEEGDKMTVLKPGASLRELVEGLNALGVGPRDLITILQTIKTAGALQADIIVR